MSSTRSQTMLPSPPFGSPVARPFEGMHAYMDLLDCLTNPNIGHKSEQDAMRAEEKANK
jgi:hypothetical protein